MRACSCSGSISSAGSIGVGVHSVVISDIDIAQGVFLIAIMLCQSADGVVFGIFVQLFS